MPRRLAIFVLLVAAFVGATAAPAAAEGRVPAGVKLADCSVDEASAMFVARMRLLPGSERMWLRFRLLEKGAAGYRSLKAPGLGRWRKSKVGVGAFAYRQEVRGLQAGTLYRAQVDFRWYDDAGILVETARRRSSACRQFDALPNLTATPIAAVPGSRPGVVRYRVLLTNEGVAPAAGVALRLSVDGAVADTVVIPSLLPAERRVVTILGTACTRSVVAAADPDGLIIESSETDNAREVRCADLTGT
ncbi:MAG: hypothetical protein QOH58_2465 [Thermoleophilaceae bacterium]|jgi:hypothetical protein|nr:hypothetical protein [Thermoleophilaceae bacterium]